MSVVRFADNQAERHKERKQLYKCMACGRQFRAGEAMTNAELWTWYQANKQTVAELSAHREKSINHQAQAS